MEKKKESFKPVTVSLDTIIKHKRNTLNEHNKFKTINVTYRYSKDGITIEINLDEIRKNSDIRARRLSSWIAMFFAQDDFSLGDEIETYSNTLFKQSKNPKITWSISSESSNIPSVHKIYVMCPALSNKYKIDTSQIESWTPHYKNWKVWAFGASCAALGWAAKHWWQNRQK